MAEPLATTLPKHQPPGTKAPGHVKGSRAMWTAKHEERAEAAGYGCYLDWIEFCETHRQDKAGEWQPMGKRRTICGAWSRQGLRPCLSSPTKHRTGRCNKHGGTSVVGVDVDGFKHGRYSRYMPERYQERLDGMAGENVADVSDELELARLRQQDYIQALREMDDERPDGSEPAANPGQFARAIAAIHRDLIAAIAADDSDKTAAAICGLGVMAKEGTKACGLWQQILSTSEHIARLVTVQTQLLKVHGEFMHRREVMALVSSVADSINEHVSDPAERKALREHVRHAMTRI